MTNGSTLGTLLIVIGIVNWLGSLMYESPLVVKLVCFCGMIGFIMWGGRLLRQAKYQKRYDLEHARKWR